MIPRGMMTGRVVVLLGLMARLLRLRLRLRALGALSLIGGARMGMEEIVGLLVPVPLVLLARLVLLGRAVLIPRVEVMSGVPREMVMVPVCRMSPGMSLVSDPEGMLAEAKARVRARARWKMVLSGLCLLRLGQG
jgi:hypothetical protein